MSIGSIGSFSQATAAQAPDNGAKVQLERDSRKADTDARTEASDPPAVAEEKQFTGTLGNHVDMYL
ncbi:MAG TPA: hypothetical protein VFO77_02295 [Actinoplanes sp.]|nr:hypothetical protein [Actinoplanes sp.]